MAGQPTIEERVNIIRNEIANKRDELKILVGILRYEKGKRAQDRQLLFEFAYRRPTKPKTINIDTLNSILEGSK